MGFIDDWGIVFLNRVRSLTNLPITAGCGIGSREPVEKLVGKIDMGVIGSHVINLYGKEGEKGVAEFF